MSRITLTFRASAFAAIGILLFTAIAPLSRADTLISKTVFTSHDYYTVPAGTNYIIVKCWGGGGGNYGLGGYSYGGYGGFVKGKFLITSGTYQVLVGAGGSSNGGDGGDAGGATLFGYGWIGAGGGGGGSGGTDGWYDGGQGGGWTNTYADNGVDGSATSGGDGGGNGSGDVTVYDFVSQAGNDTDPDWASPAGIGAGYIDFEGHEGRVVILAYRTVPGITSSLSQRNLAQNQSDSYTITASNSPTSFSASGLPTGLSINTGNGVISGNATTPGTYNATIAATNGAGSDTKSLTWVVTAASITPNASVTPGAVQQGQSVTIYRDGDANFGVAYTQGTIWKPNGQHETFGPLPKGSHSYTPNGGLGTYSIQFRVVDNYANYADQWISFDQTPLVHTLPYTTGYELAESYNPGSLHAQNGWVVPLGLANIATEQAQQGSYGLKIVPGTVADVKKYFSSNQDWAFVDVYVRPIATSLVTNSSLVDYGAARIGFVSVSGQGAIYVYHGNGSGSGTWTDTNIRFPIVGSGQSTGWIRLTVRHDYAGHVWDLYANGTMIYYGCGMVSNAASSFTDLNWWGHSSSVAYFDNFTATTTHPLFTDADHDGMSDTWESANGLNTGSNDRAGDLDGDGLSNLAEYFLGTKANNADRTVPSAPTSFYIVSTAPTSLGFSWSGAADTGSGTPGISGYNIYRNGFRINGSLVTTTSFTETGLTGGTAYSYIVKTVDLAGNESAGSTALSLTTPASSTSGAFHIFAPLP